MSEYTYSATYECAKTGNRRTLTFLLMADHIDQLGAAARAKGHETIHHLLRDVDWLIDHCGPPNEVIDTLDSLDVKDTGWRSEEQLAGYLNHFFPQKEYLEGMLSCDDDDMMLDDMGKRIPMPDSLLFLDR